MKSLKSMLMIVAFFVCWPGAVRAQEADELGGTIEAEIDGRLIQFPSLKTDIDADINGDLVTVKIIQVFENPTNVALNARYLFPLNQNSAVFAMTMEAGGEIVSAKIQRKEEAQKTFEAAKKEGKAASLLTQHRPNMFEQNIANLMPSLPITVILEYTQHVPKVDGSYELALPIVVGPRYEPEGMGQAPEVADNGVVYGSMKSTSTSAFGTWELESPVEYPDVTGLTLPDAIDAKRVSIKVSLQSGIDIQNVASATHSISVEGDARNKLVTLREGRVIDNADFVLRYTLAGETTQAGFMATRQDKEGFFSLMIEPPELPKESQISAREMVFVLDTSGSMSGEPIEASKTFMHQALKHLRRGDTFRIIRFSNDATEYASAPVPADPAHIEDGLRYVDGLYADGGTEIPTAIQQAFSVPEQPNTLRIVVFLTDGYIGDEASVLRQIAGLIGNARIYAFGVGTSVNRYLLEEMGRQGRGFARFIDPTENVQDAAISLAKKLNAPVLTDISIDWGGMDVKDITPDTIPDLFAGDSLRVQGRFSGHGQHTIRVNGKVQGRAASLPLEITLPAVNDRGSGKAIPLNWARSRISDLMRHLNTPTEVRTAKVSDDALKEQVVKLGLDFSLMTQWTSFVAVSKKVVNARPQDTREASVPLPMVKGVTAMAYPQAFSGGSVPEPATTGGLFILGGAAAASLRRKRRRALQRRKKRTLGVAKLPFCQADSVSAPKIHAQGNSQS